MLDTWVIATSELRLGVRNRWVVLSTLMLLLFAVVLSLVGSSPAGDVKADTLSITVASLATLSVYLVPLLALLVSFDGVAGEIDRGTLPLMLATPVSRVSVIAGKFLGHLAVVSIAIVIGYGLAGVLVIMLGNSGLAGVVDLLRLIGTSVLLGAAFVGISLICSSLVRQSGTAAALAIGVWLVSVVLYDLALLGLLVSAPGPAMARVFPWLLLANPADAFRVYNMAALGLEGAGGGLTASTQTLPYATFMPLLALVVWALLALWLAIVSFKRIEP